MANSQDIRAMIRSEILAQSNNSRFGIGTTSNHQHTGLDAPQINQNNILPGNSVEGSVSFLQTTIYKIGVNFNPTSIAIHGNVTGTSGSERFIVVGNVKFGPSLYLQPGSTTSVVTGGPSQDIIQSTTYFGSDSGGTLHTVVSEGHIVDIFYTSTIFARATVIGYDNQNVLVQVETLASGWGINLSFTIT